MKFFLIILLNILTVISFAQQKETDFILVRSYEGDITDAAIDYLGNLYIISSSGQIIKFNEKGDSVGVFNAVRNSGKLHSIDVSNPLKPLLFYKDFSTVIILDRFLANRSTLDLRKYSILQPAAIGLSYDNNIWVFDEYDSKLKKLDEQGNKLFESTDFRSIFSQSIRPSKIINESGSLYLADTAAGIFIFDNYGTYRKRIDVKNWTNFEVKKGTFIRTANDEIIIYNPVTFSDIKRKVPESFKPYIRSFTNNNRFITFDNKSLKIYNFNY